MARHKRRKPKNARGGCLSCKPWKMNGAQKDSNSEKYSDWRRRETARMEAENV